MARRHEKVGEAIPGPDVIELWFASTLGFGSAEVLLDLWPLSLSERERAARFRLEKDRRAFVLGKRLVRTLLGRALELSPESVELRSDANGKPELAGIAARSGLTFNVAHSGTEVVCALGLGRPVGVDIERERDDLDPLPLARRYFCINEIRELEGRPPGQAQRIFFRYWTLKEAYAKAAGSGLRLSLSAMDASVVPDSFPTWPCRPAEDRERGLLVQPIEAPPGYAAAVASSAPRWVTCRNIWREVDYRITALSRPRQQT